MIGCLLGLSWCYFCWLIWRCDMLAPKDLRKLLKALKGARISAVVDPRDKPEGRQSRIRNIDEAIKLVKEELKK
jgi:hypothetical protein